MKDTPVPGPVRIALALEDRSLRARIAAALEGLDGIILVRRSEEADLLIHAASAVSAPRTTEPQLTPCEQEVLLLMAESASNKAIAEALGVSVHTEKFHVSRLIDKFDAVGRTDAVAQAARIGVIRL